MSTDWNEADHPRGNGDGKFTEKPAADPGDQVLVRRHPLDVVDDPRVIAALGDGDPLSEEEKETLRILLDHEIDPDEQCADLDEALERWGSFDNWEVDHLSGVADWMSAHYSRGGDYGAFQFELIRDGDGAVSQYQVGASVPGTGVNLTMRSDTSDIGFRGADGLRGALRCASTLMGDHDYVHRELRKLVPEPGCEHRNKWKILNGREVCHDCGALCN